MLWILFLIMHNLMSDPPLTDEQRALLQTATESLSATQLAWVSGYLWGLSRSQPQDQPHAGEKSSKSIKSEPAITVISASQTGNARGIAEQLGVDLRNAKLTVTHIQAGEFKFKQLAQCHILIMIVSTQGEGDPPEEAIALYKYLISKKAPKLKNTAFAVLGLGDSSYQFFCQAGKDFDSVLASLGAERLVERVDADIEYQAVANRWRQALTERLQKRLPAENNLSYPPIASSEMVRLNPSAWTKDNPCTVRLSVKQKITGRNSTKDIRHLELELTESLRYQPGDALGVWFNNDPRLVQEFIELQALDPEAIVEVKDQSMTLQCALTSHLELTVNSTKLVKHWALHAGSEALLGIAANHDHSQAYALRTPLIDMLQQNPATLGPQQFCDFFRPLTPRLYSIASSQAEFEDEIHLTVSAVRYSFNGKTHCGGASCYLADRLEEEADLRVFIEQNPHFRLPSDPSVPMIMIAAGTGIAPFRAFMQQRDATQASGKNWLFFGNPHFAEDFLYQIEWQDYVKRGLLNKICLAWSRDTSKKVYVQNSLVAEGRQLWQWLTDGAHIYVCGDALHMAKDVEQALLSVCAEQGGFSREDAEAYLSELRLAKRYQRDVY